MATAPTITGTSTIQDCEVDNLDNSMSHTDQESGRVDTEHFQDLKPNSKASTADDAIVMISLS